MEIGVLQKGASREISRFESEVGAKDYDDMLFLYMNRITEEIGNLATGVMGAEGLSDEPKKDLKQYFADALYSIIVLAQKMDVDLHDALSEKVKLLQEMN